MIEKLSADVRATHMTQSYFDHVAAVAKLGSILYARGGGSRRYLMRSLLHPR